MLTLIDSVNIKENLIILDWDDTILPTTWLEINNVRPKSIVKSFYTKEMALYENYCYDFLNEVRKNGNIIIITNADEKWVESTCKEYLPKILPIISTIKIISAYSIYNKIVNCPFKLKEMAFKNEIELYIKENPNIVKNILSIGDAEYERIAVRSINKNKKLEGTSEICFIKSIKLSENPNLELIREQLDVITKNITSIISKKETLDLVLGYKSTVSISPTKIINPNKILSAQ
jgi:hypothetical protein